MQNTATASTSEAAQPAQKAVRRKPHRRPAHMSLDARSWQSKLLHKTQAELTAHVGGQPSVTQRALIVRAAWLTVYLAEMDARATAGQFMSNHDSKVYLAWSNSLAKTIARIGLKAADQKPATLRDHMAAREGGAA